MQGWIKIHSYTEERNDILNYSYWLVGAEGALKPMTLESGGNQGSNLLAKLEQIRNRNEAESLIGQDIWVDVGQLPRLKEGEYFWYQLQGLQVMTISGVILGTVQRLMETGANDVLVVVGEVERLIPYLPDVVLKVDLVAKLIEVDWDPSF